MIIWVSEVLKRPLGNRAVVIFRVKVIVSSVDGVYVFGD